MKKLVFILTGIVLFSCCSAILLKAANTEESVDNNIPINKSSQQDRNDYYDYDYDRDIFSEMMALQKYMNRVFDDFPKRYRRFATVNGNFISAPDFDMYETNDTVIVECDLPGMEKDKIDITVENNRLTICGKREQGTTEQKDEEGYKYYHKSISYGSFSKSLRLPDYVDTSNIQASYNDGVLKINIPKTTKEDKKEIKVNIT